MMVIFPYNIGGIWMFDDESRGLVREPFIGNSNRIIDKMAARVPNAEAGFSLLFSASAFPEFDLRLEWRRGDGGSGNYYYSPDLDQEGWLCPALLKYFPSAPRELYVKAEPKRT